MMEVKEKDSKKIIDGKKFITKLSETNDFQTEDLEQLYSQLLAEKNLFQLHQDCLLKTLFQNDGELQFLINLWLEHRSKRNFTSADFTLLNIFQTILIQVQEYVLVGKELEVEVKGSWSSKKFYIHLIEQIDSTLIYYLNSKNFFLQLSTLKLLVQFAQTQLCGKLVLNLLEGLHKESLKNMLLNEPTRLNEEIQLTDSEISNQKQVFKKELRDTFYELWFSILESQNYVLIQQSLSQNTFNKLFDKFNTDSFATISKLVTLLEPLIIVEEGQRYKVHPKAWSKIFNRQFLQKAIELLSVKEDAVDGNSRSKLIYKFLVKLTSTPKSGLAYQTTNPVLVEEPKLDDISTTQYHPLTELIQILKPSQYLIHRQLLLRVLQANLTLVPTFWSKTKLNFEPSLTCDWVSNCVLLQKIVNLQCTDYTFLIENRFSIEQVASYILPSKFSKAYQLKGIQYDGMVTYFTVQSLLCALNRFQRIVDFFTETTHGLDLDRLELEVQRRFVDFSAFQPLLNQMLNPKDATKVQVSVLKRSVVQLSLLYQHLLNSDATLKSVELTKLLPTTLTADDPDLILHLKLLASSSNFTWYKPQLSSNEGEFKLSPLLNLISLQLTQPQLSKLRDEVVFGWLYGSVPFHTNLPELKVWCSVLKHESDIVLSLVDVALTKLMKQPYFYSDSLNELFEFTPTSSNQLPSPLLISLAEAVLKDQASRSLGLDLLVALIKLSFLKFGTNVNFKVALQNLTRFVTDTLDVESKSKWDNLELFLKEKSPTCTGKDTAKFTEKNWQTTLQQSLGSCGWLLHLIQLVEKHPDLLVQVQNELKSSQAVTVMCQFEILNQSLLDFLDTASSTRVPILLQILSVLPTFVLLLGIPLHLIVHPIVHLVLDQVVLRDELARPILIDHLLTAIVHYENTNVSYLFHMLEVQLLTDKSMGSNGFDVIDTLVNKFNSLSRPKQFRTITLLLKLQKLNQFVVPDTLIHQLYPADASGQMEMEIDYKLLVLAGELLTKSQLDHLFDYLTTTDSVDSSLCAPLLCVCFVSISQVGSFDWSSKFQRIVNTWNSKLLTHQSLYLNYLNQILLKCAPHAEKLQRVQGLDKLCKQVVAKKVNGKQHLELYTLHFLTQVLPIYPSLFDLFNPKSMESFGQSLLQDDHLPTALSLITNLNDQPLPFLPKLTEHLITKLSDSECTGSLEPSLQKLANLVVDFEVDLTDPAVQRRPVFLARTFRLSVAQLSYPLNLINSNFLLDDGPQDSLLEYLDFIIEQLELDSQVDIKFRYFKDLITNVIGKVGSENLQKQVLRLATELIVKLDIEAHKESLKTKLMEWMELASEKRMVESIVPTNLIQLITTTFRKDYQYFGLSDNLTKLIQLYGGTLSWDDQLLLDLLCVEEIQFQHPQKLLLLTWNNSLCSNDSTKLNDQLLQGDLVRLTLTNLKSELVENMLKVNFSGLELLEFNNVAETDDGKLELNRLESTYDPKFLLPLTCHLIAIAEPKDTAYFLTSNVIPLLILCLANVNPTVRIQAASALQDFFDLYQLEPTPYHKKPSLALLTSFRHSIKIDPTDSTQFPQLGYIFVRFVTSCLLVLQSPTHPSYLFVLNTVLKKVSLDPTTTYHLNLVDNPFHTTQLHDLKVVLDYVSLSLDCADSFIKLKNRLDKVVNLVLFEPRLERYLITMVDRLVRHREGLQFLKGHALFDTLRLKLSQVEGSTKDSIKDRLLVWFKVVLQSIHSSKRFDLHTSMQNELILLLTTCLEVLHPNLSQFQSDELQLWIGRFRDGLFLLVLKDQLHKENLSVTILVRRFFNLVEKFVEGKELVKGIQL